MDKSVYFFGGEKTDGNAKMSDILGGKGANLAEMANIGIRVPAGFTIATTVCKAYMENKNKIPAEVLKEIDDSLAKLEKVSGKKLGDPSNPLLVSVRSGAAVSMPGMMDTILNVGLNPKVVEGLSKKTGNARFVWDSYRRLIQMYGDVVMEVDKNLFEEALHKIKEEHKAKQDVDLNEEGLRKVVKKFLEIYKEKTKQDFPEDPKKQFMGAVEAVFRSWNNDRAIKYRQIYQIKGLIGTAANVQSMVFGNMGEGCGTGVVFTRDVSSGENVLFGEILFNAQGEDVVAGIRTPLKIAQLNEKFPKIYKELLDVKNALEKHYKDVQDVEFTIEKEVLYILQTRRAKRAGFAEVRIAVELVKEGVVDEKTALARMDPLSIDFFLHPIFNPKEKEKAVKEGHYLAKGLNAGPGAASGKIVFDAHRAEEYAKKQKVILVRNETSPEDIGGINVSQGILTKTGGMTSHAALVARGMGKTCIVGCVDIEIDYEKKTMKVKNKTFKELDEISIDGYTGEVFSGKISTQDSEVIRVLSGQMKAEESPAYALYQTIMEWSEHHATTKVRTNADTPEDARRARAFGAKGIGLCRTEHMFFEKERIPIFRKMILCETEEDRKKALLELLPFQRADFVGIFKAMNGFPVTIRLLDPPLHEFLPHGDDVAETARILGLSPEFIEEKSHSLKEANPMLGHRGCRLSISYPEICDMQVKAILGAACEVKKAGVEVFPEIMIPLVGIVEEFKFLKERILSLAQGIFKEEGTSVEYLIGTMIEIPRACLVADRIGAEAQFFSFGTNDLTQMTFGFSRDDIGTFLPHYLQIGILEEDPFASIDVSGVGELVKMAVQKGRSVRPDLKIGICGEHGGEPKSVIFCHNNGLNYVSCSPPRVPIARLAAAQAVLKKK